MPDTSPTLRERILEAAFNAFMRYGYAGASTAQIANIAHVSKRDLYVHFPSKQAMLAACVAERAARMRRPLDLPTPADRDGLRAILIEFGTSVIHEVGQPEVLATYRLAVMESENAPNVARTLDRQGRAANTEALTGLISAARDRGLLSGGEPAAMTDVFLGVLMSSGLLVRLLMRVVEPPTAIEARQRAATAADCLLRLHGT